MPQCWARPFSGRLASFLCGAAHVAWLLAAIVGASRSAAAAEREALQQWARTVVSVEYSSGDATRWASGVLVAEEGIVATSYYAAVGAAKARARFHSGETVEVAGVVGVDRGKDLVLLALRAGETKWPAATIVARDLRIDEPTHGIGGPASAPLLVASDQLAAIESGQRYRLSRLGNDPRAVDDDQRRLITYGFLTWNSWGGGLFGDDGQLLGILTATSDWNDRVQVAVDARHVSRLLRERQTPRSLASLRSADADSPAKEADQHDVEAVVADEGLPDAPADDGERGLPQRERLRRLRYRLAELPQERKRLEDRSERWRKESRTPQQAFEQLQQQAAFNRLQFTSMQPELLVPVRTARAGAGSTGTAQMERRFSPRQIVARQQLDQALFVINLQLAAADAERLKSQSRMQQIEFDRGAIARYSARLVSQAFFLSDPLALRSLAEADDALGELDAEIDQGGAAAVFVLARGLARSRLRRWDEAQADFEQVIEDDRALALAAELALARLRMLRGEAGARESLAKALRTTPDEPIAWTVRARCELDQALWPAASRSLRSALEAGGDVAELEGALAWIAIREGGVNNARRGAQHARTARKATRGSDWNSRAALAWCLAGQRQWDAAQSELNRAEEVASDFGLDLVRTWQDRLRRQEGLEDLFASERAAANAGKR